MRAPRLLLVAAAATALSASLAAWAIRAQPVLEAPPASSPPASSPAAPPAAEAPPGAPVIETRPDSNSVNAAEPTAPAPRAEAKPAPPAPPPAPVLPIRSPAAVLQVLDKVTAETMRFAAPVGQRVRYKNLVFTVKACETSDLDQPAPQASAYVVVEFRPLAVEGLEAAPAKQVYKGWMFAESPGLHPLQHPTYDAWLITCIAALPSA